MHLEETAIWLDGLRAHPEVRRLARALALSQRFHLYVMVCNEPRVVHAVVPALLHLLTGARNARVAVRWLPRHPEDTSEGPLTRDDLTEEVLRPLVDPDLESARHGVIHVVDGTAPAQEGAWVWCLQRMNERRNLILRRLHGAVLLCATPPLEATIATFAPDVWSVRSGTYMVDVEVPTLQLPPHGWGAPERDP